MYKKLWKNTKHTITLLKATRYERNKQFQQVNTDKGVKSKENKNDIMELSSNVWYLSQI